MSKKKKKYRTSGKPRIAAMNEYIYNTLKDDLAKEFKVNRPYKPKKIKKAQAMKGVTVRTASKAEQAYYAYKGPKFSKLPGASKPMPPSVPKGFKVGDKRYIPKKQYAPPKGYVAPSQQPVAEQRLLKDFRGTGSYIREKYKSKYYVREVQEYVGKPKPRYKSGTSSPIKLSKQTVSKAAQKALLTKGAKLAAKGASRLIPGVGTALLIKDVSDALTKTKATEYVPQFGAKGVNKKYKKGKNY